jgi:monoamine oxidase
MENEVNWRQATWHREALSGPARNETLQMNLTTMFVQSPPSVHLCSAPHDEFTLVATSQEPDMKTPSVAKAAPQSSDVIVIGAGAAGLSAAKTLTDAGRSTTVLEARDRIGGRTRTDDSWGVPLDDGGSWAHGPEHNPLVQVAESLGIEFVEGSWDDLIVGKRFANAREKSQFGAAQELLLLALDLSVEAGLDFSLQDLVSELRVPAGLFERLTAAVLKRDEARAGEDEEQLAAADAGVEKALDALRAHYEAGGGTGPQLAFNSLPFAFVALDEVASLEAGQIAAKTSTFDAGSFNSTDDDAVPEGGMGHLIAEYGKDVPVELSTAAKKVEWGEDGVKVTADDGRIFTSDKLVLTVPVSVVNKIKFDPELPETWTEAFEGIPMAVMNKIHLQFRDASIFGEETDKWVSVTSGPDDQTEKGLAFWLRPEGSGVVTVFVGGEKARELEQKGEQGMVKEALDQLRRVYGKAIDENFIQGRATQWGQDEWSLGSYTSAAPGSAHLRENLREDVAGQLFYAGEAAASFDKNGSVGGAFESGVTTANRILDQFDAEEASQRAAA